jgi:hypothetical protein
MFRTTRGPFLAMAVVTMLLIPSAHSAAAATHAASPSDFDGDGHADLAIGVPGETIGGHRGAGAVNVLYGTASGLTRKGDQFWHQDSDGIKGASHGSKYDGSAERFGAVLASGDFDRDGRADLAIGVPGDRVGADEAWAGGVNVLYGSKHGLAARGNQHWTQARLPGTPQDGDGFGDALAAADLDGDGYWDLAIGAPEDAPVAGDIGSVTILFGGPGGLTARDPLVLRLGDAAPGDPGKYFGDALATGDLDADGRTDLAVGASADEGEVAVFYGAPGGLGSGTDQRWSRATPGIIPGESDRGFGESLAIGDYDADGTDDLAIGAPGRGYPRALLYDGIGSVAVLYGTIDGLAADGNKRLVAPPSGVPSDDDYGPGFGRTLAAGDFDRDGADDLAVGVEQAGQRNGVVVVFEGGGSGLAQGTATLWSEDSAGIPGTSERGDRFGSGLAGGDFTGSGHDDLVIGISGEDVVAGTSGRVIVVPGGPNWLRAAGARTCSQATPGVRDDPEPDDRFGAGLAGAGR